MKQLMIMLLTLGCVIAATGSEQKWTAPNITFGNILTLEGEEYTLPMHAEDELFGEFDRTTQYGWTSSRYTVAVYGSDDKTRFALITDDDIVIGSVVIDTRKDEEYIVNAVEAWD